MNDAMAAATIRDARRLVEAMAPRVNGRSYLNFAEGPTDVSTAYREEDLRRLQAIRAGIDPDGLMHANHQVAAA